MKNFISYILIMSCFFTSYGQTVVELARLSINSNYDEFAPSFYQDGLIISSNRKSTIQRTVVEIDETGKENFLNQLHYVSFKQDSVHNAISLLEVNNLFVHNGPAVTKASLMVVAHPQLIRAKRKRKKYGTVGLFFYTLKDGKSWVNEVPFKYNSVTYNLSHPALSADGQTLYFVSDDEKGYGGMDIWKSRLLPSGDWSQPQNLGDAVNTEHNEVFPTLNGQSNLYFSSDRPATEGGYDIFYYNIVKDKLVSLKKPFNSLQDDYSYISKDGGKSGFLSSNREGNDDIFYFTRKADLSEACRKSRKKSNCFIFSDNKTIPDGSKIGYSWDFGDGTKEYSETVKHCFTSPGEYQVQMSIIDSVTGITEVTGTQLFVKVDSSTMFYLKHENEGENNLLHVYPESGTENKAKVEEVFWKVDNSVLYDLESFNLPNDLPGRYAVESHLLLNDSTIYCITDTLEVKRTIDKKSFKYHLVHVSPEHMLTEDIKIDLMNEVKTSVVNKTFLLDLPAYIYVDKEWKKTMQELFKIEFEQDLDFRSVKNTDPIVLSIK